MDPFYFTTDLDYAFGANSGFNPQTDVQVQTARKTAAAKQAKAQKPVQKKQQSRRLNYDGMNFKDAFAAARKAGLGSFSWRGKKYTTDIAEPQSAPYIENIPIDVETGLVEPYIDRAWNPVAAMAAYQADAGLRKAAMSPTGQISVPGVRVPNYGYGGFILPDIVLF